MDARSYTIYKMKSISTLMAIFAIFAMLENTASESLNDDKLDIITNYDNHNELDCQVHHKYSQENWLGHPLRILVFIEYGEKLSTLVGFHNKSMATVYDQIIISQEGIIRAEIRNGNVKTNTSNQYIDTAGWTWIEISMDGNQFIVKYEDSIAVKYTIDQPVNELVIHGSNITACGSPTWILEEGQSVVIPLEPSRQAANPFVKETRILTLQSDDGFTPCFVIDGNKTCLGHDDNGIIILTNTSKPSTIPPGKWVLHLELDVGFLNIYQKISRTQNIVTRFQLEQMKLIEVTSDKSKFTVSLHVLSQANSSSDDACIDCNDTSCYSDMWIGILIGVASSVTTCTILSIGYLILKKQMFKPTCKITKMDEANKDSTKQTFQKSLDEENPLV